MKRRTLGLAIAGVMLVGLVVSIVLFVVNRGMSSGSADVTWNVPDGAVSSTDAQSLKQALQSSAGVSALTQRDRALTITQASSLGDYSVMYADIHRRSESTADTGADPALLVGVRAGGTWRIVTELDSDFCAAMKSTPDTILPAGTKSYFIGC